MICGPKISVLDEVSACPTKTIFEKNLRAKNFALQVAKGRMKWARGGTIFILALFAKLMIDCIVLRTKKQRKSEIPIPDSNKLR